MIEAMKQALEVFEDIASWYDHDRSVGSLANSMYEAKCLATVQATSLRQAIEQAEKQEKVQTIGETNVELDFHSDVTCNGQQRQLVGEVEMGQLVGNRSHKSAGNPESEGAAAVIIGVDEYGPLLDWYRHWINFPVGTAFYTTPPAAQPEPDLLNALKRILDEPNNTMSDGKALKEIIRIARAAINKATGEKT